MANPRLIPELFLLENPMLPEDMPQRQSRDLLHAPPDWVGRDAVFFITINCKPRGGEALTSGDMPTRLFQSIAFQHERGAWYPEMVLLMPDHLHALMSFSWEEKRGMSRVISAWKRYTAKQFGISWQRDYFDHRIRSEADHQSTWFYIRENPVRAGLVKSYNEWPNVWFPTGIGWPSEQAPGG